MGGDRFDDLVDRFTFHLGADDVHLGPVGFRHPQEPNPVAVANASPVGGGDLVVQSEAVANLKTGRERETKRDKSD